jgi:hypothetical protein
MKISACRAQGLKYNFRFNRTYSVRYDARKFDPKKPRQHYENLELVAGPTVTRKRIKEQVGIS